MNAPAKAGRYALLDELGRGAMGVVYRAQDPVIGRTVAVKTVRLDAQAAGMSQEELLHRFQTEARAAGRLTHPNIVVVYDAGEEDGLFYITMELVEGQSLQELLEKHVAFPLPRVLRLMQQACSALDFAHQNKVVHRDIKPANLMLTQDDTLKITDFGTAKILRYGTVQTAQVIGTPSYMSPEQVRGRPVDGRSDIFSLGVVLYELVTGEKPFPGESVTTVIYKIVNEEPIPPRELDSSIPAGLSAVITRALSKAPAGRFQTCREFMEALQNYREFAPGSGHHAYAAKKPAALPSGLPSSPSTVSTAQHSPLLSTASRPKQAQQSNPVWAVLILLAIIGGAGYRVWPALTEIRHRIQEARASAAVSPAQTQAPAAPLAENSPQAAPPVAPPAPAVATNQQPVEKPAAPTQAEPVLAKLPAPPPDMPPESATPALVKNPTSPKPSPGSIEEKPRLQGGQLDSSAPAAKPENPQAPQRLLPTPAAARLQRRVEEVLVSAGINEKVQVTAVGNSLTLTGKLSPAAHARLVNWLQNAPTRVQIIDDIEYAEDSGPMNSGVNAVPFQ